MNTILKQLVAATILTSSLSGQDVVIRPEAGPGPLDNPLKGWCPYTDAGEIHQPYSMVYFYVSWKDLEPEQGEYRFEEWEQTWDVSEAQDKHIVFRVYVDYPSMPSGMPDWLRSTGIKETQYEDYGGGLSPDYDDPRMIEAMEELIAALGQRYNDHPRIAFVQLGLLGFWGEWHTWPREEIAPSPETEQKVIDAYRAAFPDKSLMVRYAKGYAGEQDWIGFHDDMFPEDIDNGEDWSFMAGLRATGRTNNWKSAVIGGEMVPNQGRRWMERGFPLTTKMLNKSHFSWVGPYCPALERTRGDQFVENCQALVRRMGYEYQLTEIRHLPSVQVGKPFEISVQGKNSGVAPFYYPWSVEWALLDERGRIVDTAKTDWDIREWQPGDFEETGAITFEAEPGSYRLAIGIRDPWQDRPAIRFANELELEAGWTIISSVRVER